MKRSSLFFLTLCLPFFSGAERVTKTNLTFIESSKVSGWNHIGDKHGDYAALSHPLHKYQLNKKIVYSSNKPLYAVTLVKKLLNWEQQHSNGFEVSLAHLNLQVKQFTQLHFKIKLSPEQSIIIADFETLSENNKWLNDIQQNTQNNKDSSQNHTKNFAKLLSKHTHFNLIFYGENHENPKQKTLYAAYPFKINIDSKEAWHAINITTNDLNYYWQQNYQEEPTSATEVAKQKWQGFILVAESANSKVVRNYIPAEFPKEYTEVFNEFDISVTDIQVSSTLSRQ